ncbi:MAG TPA: TatD family hydrolase [Chitinophagaceae bacterium]|jgi:TatD DNase family protein|nr:TatD family hydrolase [Chitinophagaceae bacterium]
MILIDTHCHLYASEFDADRTLMIERAQHIGIQEFYLPGIDSEAIDGMLNLEKQYPNICFPMMGLHPCYVKDNYLQELNIVENWLKQRKFVAIGEIGLDFYWDKTFATQQQEAFEQQMQWALDYRLPIVIHTREAMQATIDAVKPFAKKGLKGIFHCFSGSYESAKEIIGMNFLLGIGGVVTYKNAGLSEVVGKLDLKHVVLETDAPYLSPVPFRGKRNESSYLEFVLKKIAEVKQITIEEVATITTQNAKELFGT